jgi:hypothetical protein
VKLLAVHLLQLFDLQKLSDYSLEFGIK